MDGRWDGWQSGSQLSSRNPLPSLHASITLPDKRTLVVTLLYLSTFLMDMVECGILRPTSKPTTRGPSLVRHHCSHHARAHPRPQPPHLFSARPHGFGISCCKSTGARKSANSIPTSRDREAKKRLGKAVRCRSPRRARVQVRTRGPPRRLRAVRVPAKSFPLPESSSPNACLATFRSMPVRRRLLGACPPWALNPGILRAGRAWRR